ncbi:O-acyltransferase like protein-like [Battus philenor]|uniref:O-acyltransferase like protein-like n=1 Tax=Battus philenor TaxID=42288 RepID=UPI0035CF716E
MKLKTFLLIIISCAIIVISESRKFESDVFPRNPFDKNLYEDVLDPELCEDQIKYIRNNNTILWLQFLDAGIRIPRGILNGNTMDLGNYYQCLNINKDMNRMNIQGKFCVMRVNFDQAMKMNLGKNQQWNDYDNQHLHFIDMNQIKIDKSHTSFMFRQNSNITRLGPDTALSDIDLRLGVCIPASCTTREGVNGLLTDVSTLGVNYEEQLCRLPDDKPWVPIDYVAIAIFSTIAILTFLSTCFEFYYLRILKKDKRNTNSLYFCFSAYANTKRVLNFTSGPETLECIDGVRALAMIWVILGHSFTAIPFYQNPMDAFLFSTSPRSIWMIAAHLTVDTFFMLSGLLVVYTVAGKLTGEQLLRSLHIFYLNRLLRMFPILAAALLFEVSLFNHISDGPLWEGAAGFTARCRKYWWSTLMHIQNFVNPGDLCMGVTWYLSIDVQLHILSPILLFWVLSKSKRAAWAALAIGTLVALTASTLYIFYHKFPSGVSSPNRPDDMDLYFRNYYINILTRAPPFFVGMIFGYLLHLWKGKKLNCPKVVAVIQWCFSMVLLSVPIYCMHVNIQLDWNNQSADNFINAFSRSLWATGLGWVIFACVKGYGGPINWFLSLQIWKLPGRLSYAMYIIHYPVMIGYYYSVLGPIYFSVANTMFNFFAFVLLTFTASFIIVVTIDAPFSTLVKMLLQKGSRQPSKATVNISKIDNFTPVAEVKTNGTNPAFAADEDKSLSTR